MASRLGLPARSTEGTFRLPFRSSGGVCGGAYEWRGVDRSCALRGAGPVGSRLSAGSRDCLRGSGAEHSADFEEAVLADPDARGGFGFAQFGGALAHSAGGALRMPAAI